MTTGFKDIIFLLGAGASAQAGIPPSGQMIDKIEERLSDTWQEHRDLYFHIKSGIYFASGIKGKFKEVVYNIEVLVNTLYELERNETHPLYPFIASWNSRFLELAGTNFENIQSFRNKILQELKSWMCPEDPSLSDYYKGFVTLQRELTYPLRIFSLNYDLCIDQLHSPDNFRVETGFEGSGPRFAWDFERFEEIEGGQPAPEIYLYKMHGSINWKRDESSGNLYRVEQISTVDAKKMEVVFGKEFKLEAADPYLFYAYEFRRFALLARLIVTIGYGFGDIHINKILSQALQKDPDRRLVVVLPGKEDERLPLIKQQLGNNVSDRIIFIDSMAKEFLEKDHVAELLSSKIPKPADAPF